MAVPISPFGIPSAAGSWYAGSCLALEVTYRVVAAQDMVKLSHRSLGKGARLIPKVTTDVLHQAASQEPDLNYGNPVTEPAGGTINSPCKEPAGKEGLQHLITDRCRHIRWAPQHAQPLAARRPPLERKLRHREAAQAGLT